MRVEPHLLMDRPDEVALLALEAVGRGARVLVVRNTVAGAVATARALEALAGFPPKLLPATWDLFRLGGGPHSLTSMPQRRPIHPRVGGGAAYQAPPDAMTRGPSPRGRGADDVHMRGRWSLG